MNNNNLVRAAAIVILVPVAVGAVIGTINLGLTVSQAIMNANYRRKIKKGLKEGTIAEIDGQYYKVEQLNSEIIEEA
ncbi:MAG: hypothetical protein LBL45_07820 [Treponema sp.]|nr:hypothetical protein [Treponema sp.]